MPKTLEQLRPFYTCHPITTSLISIPEIHADVVNPGTINLPAKAPAGRQSVPRHKTMHVTIFSRLGQPSLSCFGFGVRVPVLSWTYSPLPFLNPSLLSFHHQYQESCVVIPFPNLSPPHQPRSLPQSALLGCTVNPIC